MLCGLLGRSLVHSYSPQIHSQLGSYPYKLFQIEPEALDAFFRDVPFDGINVTIPYKKSVIPHCDTLSPQAEQLGAVNTIVRRPDGKLVGHNTDYFGFQSMIAHSGLSVSSKKVLVLGSGGASATVVAVLNAMNATPVVISRSGENNYSNLSRHQDASIIVNTTPVGTFPEVLYAPLDLTQFPHLEGVLDLVYNPARTQLLLQAERLGLITENGLWMLVAQAKESAEWFTGKRICDNLISDIYNKLQRQMQNVVLIGMPGSGKSTIGRLLAERLGKAFTDADTIVEERAQMSIPDIFSNYGEDRFRQEETATLLELGKRSGLVIATGGGCVTREENYEHLHRNSKIIWLQRDISALPTDGRPLSQQNSLEAMYEIRKPMYERFADFAVDNNQSAEVTVETILSLMEA